MTQIELEIHDSVISALSKIKNINDSGIELVIPEGSVLFENILNLKLLKHEAEKYGFSLQFSTDDINGNNLLDMLDEKGSTTYEPEETKEFTETNSGATPKFPKLKLPQIALPHMPGLELSSFKLGSIVIVGVLVVVAGGFLLAGKFLPKAYATVTVSSQPLIRSITVKVLPNSPTDADKKILSGAAVSVDVSDSDQLTPTGTKLVGKKATGTVTLYNATSSDITLKKGTQLTYKKDSSHSYIFDTADSVTIPRTTTDNSTTPPTITSGSADVDITADDIGDAYNIAKGKSLSVKSYDTGDLKGSAKSDFSGGSSQSVTIVAAADYTNLSQKLATTNKQQAESAIQNKVSSDQKLIDGSVSTKITGETYSAKVGDQTDTLKLDQTVTATGLVYNTSDVNSLVDKLVSNFVQSGYILAKKDREISVAVLGNSSQSVVSSTEADIQVTVKTYVMPNVTEAGLKKDLAGKSAEDAQKVLGSIPNVDSYEFKVTPGIPFFQKVPKDLNRIIVTINVQ